MTSSHSRDVPDEDAEKPFTVAVASGKGGTGKTLVATNVAVWAADRGRDVVLVDCDADAPNDHLFLPRFDEATAVVAASVAAVERSTCTGCGACRDVCAFGAVRVLGEVALVFEELCHGCGLCLRVCPSDALRMVDRRVGTVTDGVTVRSSRLRLVSGTLDIGQVKAPDVIRAAVAAGTRSGAALAILDAPPGVACPVVAALHGADALLLVTEPTPFGVHDLALALDLGEGLGVPMAIVVNKAAEDIGEVERLGRTWDAPVLSTIPFDRRVAQVYADGRLVSDTLRTSAEWLDPVLAWVDRVAAACGRREVTRS